MPLSNSCCRYQNEIVLSDLTIGYHLARIFFLGYPKPVCGLLSKTSGVEIELMECESKAVTAYVCEFESPTNETSPAVRTVNVVSLSHSTQWHRNGSGQSGPDSVTCPKGHTTHTFLACDMISECWPEESRSGSGSARGVCSAPLTPLPPSFACRGRGGHVPYTLVCDHRPDCFDGSDEDFCVFHSGHSSAADEFICWDDSSIQCGRTHEVCNSTKSNSPGQISHV